MQVFEKIMVALNWDDHDPGMLEYTSMLARLVSAKQITFVHIEDSSLFNFPDPEIQKEYNELRMACTPESMRELVDQTPGFENLEVHCQVHHGSSVLFQLIHLVRENDVDLMVVGRKNRQGRTGTLAENLVRKAPCSVMVVPWGALCALSKIMVPVDFSSYSSDAMELACCVAARAGLKALLLAHIYAIPFGYHKLRKNYSQMDQMARKQAELDFMDFKEDRDTKGIGLDTVVRLNSEPQEEILKLVKELEVNLLVMGTRGKGSMVPAFLGSTTERVIREAHIPVIAVKKKGTGNEILQAIFSDLEEIRSVIA